MAYCQCEKALWLKTYRPEVAKISPMIKERLEQGNRVGEIARNLFGPYEDATMMRLGGKMLDYSAMINRTKQLIEMQAKNIAEAAFSWDGNYCAVDILHRTSDGYAIYEVKSSLFRGEEENTPENLLTYMQDVAFQKYVLEGVGITVTGSYLVRPTRIIEKEENNVSPEMFNITDLEPFMSKERECVENNLMLAHKVLQCGSEPIMRMGEQCKKPYECFYINYCSKEE